MSPVHAWHDPRLSATRESRRATPRIEVEAVLTGDGTKLRTFSFTPAAEGHWELVAYGREPKYVLMFCVSAKTKDALEKSRPAFLAMVRSYTSHDEPE